jgi:type II secretory pathway component PulJ
MLIAVGITAVLVTSAVQAYVYIQRALEQANRNEDRSRGAQVLLDRIERELVGALLIVRDEEEDRLSHPYVFIGEDRVFGGDDSDAIRFITLSPARPPAQRVGGGLRMVSYSVEPRADQGVDLLRQEDPLPEGMETQIRMDDAQVVAEQLALFGLRYLDDETGEWEERWDSTDIARLDRLPEAVEISVELLQRDATNELLPGPTHTRLVELPVRPIGEREPGPPEPNEPDPNAPTGPNVPQ